MPKTADVKMVELTGNDKELWDRVSEYAGKCSWQTTGQYLSDKMKRNDFLEWERVFAAFSQDKVIGFCAFTKDSTVLGEKYSPYIGFLFVDEAYRENHIGRKLCASAVQYAETKNFDKVYLYSDLLNYYEKMGFDKIGEEDTPWGVRWTKTVYTQKGVMSLVLSNL